MYVIVSPYPMGHWQYAWLTVSSPSWQIADIKIWYFIFFIDARQNALKYVVESFTWKIYGTYSYFGQNRFSFTTLKYVLKFWNRINKGRGCLKRGGGVVAAFVKIMHLFYCWLYKNWISHVCKRTMVMSTKNLLCFCQMLIHILAITCYSGDR